MLAVTGLALALLACGPDAEQTDTTTTAPGGACDDVPSCEPARRPATLQSAAPELAANTAIPATLPAAPIEPRSPARLVTLLAEHDRLVANGGDASEIARLREEIDQVAAQRDATTSRLYWYTDLEQAKAEAKRTGRPILSLHLLGQLDKELSCANSRLFRIVLYANPHVAAFLRDTYVLHWQSERPVPEISIDFGDGRKITRTITGNSIHYVLDSEGRVVDALPGLYGPAAFENGLRDTLDLANKSATLNDEDSQKLVAKYHEQMVWKLTARWRKLLMKSYGDTYGEQLKDARLPNIVGYNKWPDALWSSLPAAMVNQLTVSKADTEAPPLALMQPEIYVGSPWAGWDAITQHLPVDKLDPVSRAFAKTKHPRNFELADAAPLDDAAMEKRLTRFEQRLAEESARNEYAFHGTIHNHMSVTKNVAFATLNEWVYTKIFLTPKTDAWLGLMPTEALTGLQEDGVTKK